MVFELTLHTSLEAVYKLRICAMQMLGRGRGRMGARENEGLREERRERETSFVTILSQANLFSFYHKHCK